MTSSTTCLFLLGSFHFTVNDTAYDNFVTDKGRALLAYLILETDRPHRREALAALLWPSQPDQNARANLRLAFFNLRRALNQARPGLAEALFEVATAKQLAARADEAGGGPALWLDVKAFEAALADVHAHGHSDLLTCEACRDSLTQAVDLYHGPFLSGLTLSGAEPFEEWLAYKRDDLQRQALWALETLTEMHLRRMAYESAQLYARRILALLGWHEPAHRHLMRALALTGQRIAALNQYEACRETLVQELNLKPEA
jgi:DNA-binding SARP family transcriptional activator